ncbi:hypothetical protein PHLGIDRAFT_100170 [Phlebiopsis gigantea 11061_1 CR5-6]|uniref:ASTRA-associated protein 1 n=1 Tax=Phlebiopsis gigantea (strain 11061_1 CR5-6) TaxID=745531 RepID=A0A0C3P0C2_PHLG1|nr:hypothetical protein PHLGIDRAFT_100170 [Phlebiopsis gigantea 11061_1 CR5-6]
MPAPPPPSAPTHLIRTHLAAVNAVWFSEDNERLYTGDADGSVVITSTRSLRPLANWQPHTNGILGVQEWEGKVITHGRDNKLHVWNLPVDSARPVGESATTPGLTAPALCVSMDVNALNYCRFSLLPLPAGSSSGEPTALIAVPNLIESSLADVWELPSKKRLHAAIGKAGQFTFYPPTPSCAEICINSIGIIMSMHLFYGDRSSRRDQSQLRLLCAYENGSVTLRGCQHDGSHPSIEGLGWDTLWSVKLHVESVMAMAVSRTNNLALTVSADHIVGRYDLTAAEDPEKLPTACTIHRTKNPGNGAVTIRDDGRVCAVGGWDGRVRLYSTKTLKALGTLEYHKKSCQAIAFAWYEHERSGPMEVDEDVEEEMSERADRRRWLAAGSQDNRVSLWSLISFEKT